MSQIRFRCYSRQDSRMKTWDELERDVFIEATGALSMTADLVPNGDGMVLMLCTGMRDRYGVEIYEGDVIKWECPLETDMVTVGEVRLCADPREDMIGWHFVNENEDQFNRYNPLYAHCNENRGEYTVIGNIYEDPRLMEKTP